jgi:ABC-type branched-subunit amino acid transport system permease subunit
MPWLLAVLAAVIVAIPVGAVVSISSFRLSGIYLAVATFGFGLLFQNLLYKTDFMFGSFNSIAVSRPYFGSERASSTEYYYLTLAFAALVAVVILAVRRSRLGRLLRAVGESPAALEAHGVDVRVTRLLIFCLSSALAALGGALLAGVTSTAAGDPTGFFGFFNSVVLVAVLAFCGRRPLLSPLLAAVVFVVLRTYRPFSDNWFLEYQGLIFGTLAVGVAMIPALNVRRPGARTLVRSAPGPMAARLAPARGVA